MQRLHDDIAPGERIARFGNRLVRRQAFSLGLSAIGLFLTVLGAGNASAQTEGEALVVYCGRGEALVGPLLRRYETETGTKLDVRYNDTAALATQFVAEGSASPADVVFLQDSGYLGALAASERLAELPAEILDQVDERFRDPNKRWVGTSGRARVLVHNPALAPVADMPMTLEALADPKWKGKLGWAPGNSSFQAHVSLLRNVWGEEKTENWLKQVKANEPVVYPKNSPQVIAANNGEIAIGWVNHYYYHRLATEDFKARNYSFPIKGDIGNVLMVSGVAIRKGTKHADAAAKFVKFLVGEAAQGYFAQESFEYPTRPGVATHADVPALDSIGLANVDQKHLTDVGPTLALLEKLGLR